MPYKSTRKKQQENDKINKVQNTKAKNYLHRYFLFVHEENLSYLPTLKTVLVIILEL